jgi:putative transposase
MLKFRLYPNVEQRQILERTLEDCRFVYNQLLAIHKSTYKETGKTMSQYALNLKLPELKRATPSLSNVHSQVLQNINKRIRDAYHGFFVRRKLGLKTGLPRFKKYGRYKSFTYPQSGFKIEGKKLHLSKIGNVNIKLHRPIGEVVKTLTVKRMPSGKWFAVFSCEVKIEPEERFKGAVGIDMGLRRFLTDSEGRQVENPKFYLKTLKRIRVEHKKFSRKKKDSKNRGKQRVRLARAYEKIVNQRDDFLHKLSKFYTQHYSLIAVEDLKITNMVKNRNLAGKILDSSWGKFLQMLSYKAEGAGGIVLKVNPRNTSRIYKHGELDRDYNASLNILERGLSGQGLPLEPVDIKPLRVIPASSVIETGSHLTC